MPGTGQIAGCIVLLLTFSASSRGAAVHSPTHVEAHLVSRRIPVPHHRHGGLLAILEPRVPQAGCWIRACGVDISQVL